ncbi:hypothetical protein pb186bvf_017727 [Paramecium bursaria]
MYGHAITIDHKCLKAYINKGLILYELKLYQIAIEIFDNLISVDQQCIIAYYNKGNCLYQLQKYELAIHVVDEAIKLDPNCEDAYFIKGSHLFFFDIIGLCFDKIFMHQLAIENFSKTIELNSGRAEAHFQKGQSLYNLLKYQDAIYFCDQAIRLDSKHRNAYNTKGYHAHYKQDYHSRIQPSTGMLFSLLVNQFKQIPIILLHILIEVYYFNYDRPVLLLFEYICGCY